MSDLLETIPGNLELGFSMCNFDSVQDAIGFVCSSSFHSFLSAVLFLRQHKASMMLNKQEDPIIGYKNDKGVVVQAYQVHHLAGFPRMLRILMTNEVAPVFVRCHHIFLNMNTILA